MILLLVPLRAERAALETHFTRALGGSTSIQIGGRVEAAGYPGLVLAAAGHGKVQFALTAGFALAALKPELLVCAGAAGALDPDLHVGDVVVAERTVEHDFHLKFVTRPAPSFLADPTALALLRARHTSARVLTLASGDEDIVHPERAEALRAATEAGAVAWEGAGAARAARFYQTPFVEVRAITDHAGRNARVEFALGLAAAMEALAPVLLTLRDFTPNRSDIDS